MRIKHVELHKNTDKEQWPKLFLGSYHFLAHGGGGGWWKRGGSSKITD